MHVVSTHRFLFPVTDVSIVLTQVMTSSICLEETGEDAKPSEGGEGELKVSMGERKKKGSFGIHICVHKRRVQDMEPGLGSISSVACQLLIGEAGPGWKDKIPYNLPQVHLIYTQTLKYTCYSVRESLHHMYLPLLMFSLQGLL